MNPLPKKNNGNQLISGNLSCPKPEIDSSSPSRVVTFIQGVLAIHGFVSQGMQYVLFSNPENATFCAKSYYFRLENDNK